MESSSDSVSALLCSPHTPLMQSDQVYSAIQPQVSHRRVSVGSFHKTVYSQQSNTETAWSDSSKKDSQQRKKKKSLGFYTLTVSPHASLILHPESLALCPSTSLPSHVFIALITQKIGNYQVMLCVSESMHPAGCHLSLCSLLSQSLNPFLQVIHRILTQMSIVNLMAL